MERKRFVLGFEVDGDEAQLKEAEEMLKAFADVLNQVMCRNVSNIRYSVVEQKLKFHSEVQLPKLSTMPR
ncbi:MAG: hypothetical protein JO235_10980 [Chroococcidiopsidaceae cyanobacterium CP_BM_RX_35]|nr:hypothetical protein [Chroococcidiopsidaceae cyanobacterium CP_BM_RX_35]